MFSFSFLNLRVPEVTLHDCMSVDVLVLFITLLNKDDFHWMREIEKKGYMTFKIERIYLDLNLSILAYFPKVAFVYLITQTYYILCPRYWRMSSSTVL